MSSKQHFILGTAGHIDHGKSSLVRALTGTDPDRLPEEQRRGVTIELGFAHLTLPNPAGQENEVSVMRWFPNRASATRYRAILRDSPTILALGLAV